MDGGGAKIVGFFDAATRPLLLLLHFKHWRKELSSLIRSLSNEKKQKKAKKLPRIISVLTRSDSVHKQMIEIRPLRSKRDKRREKRLHNTRGK